jgi:hypothetical protein
MKSHSIYVPIGTNFQAEIPDIMNSAGYLYHNQHKIARVRKLKLHEPTANAQFYQQWKERLEGRFGTPRSYEEVVWVKKCIDEYYPGCEFE